MAEDTMQQSRLLRLPGELRNRIYEYTREAGPVGYHVVQLSGVDDAGTVTKISQPLFLGLTRVCRLLRQEFRPIYMEHTVFCTRLLDTHNLIISFILPHGATAQGNVLIDFGYVMGKIPVNILPLLHKLRQAPLVAVRAHHFGDLQIEEDLNKLLDVHRSSWLEYISLRMSRITLRMYGIPEHGNPILVQFVKRRDKVPLVLQDERRTSLGEAGMTADELDFKALRISFCV